MSFTIGIGTRLLALAALAPFFVPIPNTAMAQSIQPLEGTYWKAVELAGKATPTQDLKREAHLVFQPAGQLSGSDGCNRITGSYQLKGAVVTFGLVAAIQMACLDTGAVERAFRDALTSASRLRVVGDRLELSDAAGKRMAAFTADAQASLPSTLPGLTGTSWQLVKFQGGIVRR